MRSLACVLLGMMLLSGCGGPAEKGPQRFRLSGKVTFNGQPVPAGTIYFQPESGPAGTARIINGAYDTKNGQGTVGGPHKIMIEGFDGKGVNPGEPGQPIFKPHTIDMNLPKSDDTKDFDVPASAAEGLIISNDPA